jgi:hypothetical protein
MKTANEMRAIAETKSTSEHLIKMIMILVQSAAESGETSYSYTLRKNQYELKDIDWAISELVAKGYDCDFTENVTPSFHELNIHW